MLYCLSLSPMPIFHFPISPSLCIFSFYEAFDVSQTINLKMKSILVHFYCSPHTSHSYKQKYSKKNCSNPHVFVECINVSHRVHVYSRENLHRSRKDSNIWKDTQNFFSMTTSQKTLVSMDSPKNVSSNQA